MYYYLAWRYLNCPPEEWDARPWWQKRVAVEGFKIEKLVTEGEQEQLPDSGQVPPANDGYVDLTTVGVGGFRSLGIKEHNI